MSIPKKHSTAATCKSPARHLKTIGQIRDSGCDGRHANMNNLILAPTCRYFGVGDKNDFTVLERGRCIGHIFLSRQAQLK